MPDKSQERQIRKSRVLSMLIAAAKDGLDRNGLIGAQVLEYGISRQTATALLNDLTIAGLASSRYGRMRITEKGRRSVIG